MRRQLFILLLLFILEWHEGKTIPVSASTPSTTWTPSTTTGSTTWMSSTTTGSTTWMSSTMTSSNTRIDWNKLAEKNFLFV
ncbi:hypothetical protein EB796_002893 [Bugula neritina]|uniref:Uncharacterized protein n=1 Tax=Bugula neritina TaxID=10212 RepID=A0A7J7KLA2_BUGNE|nr:hypothetical protein EB796_002893 [Bugula neritina]